MDKNTYKPKGFTWKQDKLVIEAQLTRVRLYLDMKKRQTCENRIRRSIPLLSALEAIEWLEKYFKIE